MRYKDEGIINEGEMIFYDKISKVEVFKDEGVIFYYENNKEEELVSYVLFKNEKHKMKFIEKIKESIEALKETERDEKFYETYFDWKVYTLVIINFCLIVSFLLNWYGKTAYVPRILYPIIAIGVYMPFEYLVLTILALILVLIFKGIVDKVKKRKKVLVYCKEL